LCGEYRCACLCSRATALARKSATLAVLAEADGRFGLSLNFETKEIGFAVYERCGTTLPDDVLARAREVDGVILGPVSHLDYPPRDQGGVNDLFRSNRVESCTAALGCTHHPLFVIRVLDYAFRSIRATAWDGATRRSPPRRGGSTTPEVALTNCSGRERQCHPHPNSFIQQKARTGPANCGRLSPLLPTKAE
jgi:Isocitrate/isopropylmalate dehydrogenase